MHKEDFFYSFFELDKLIKEQPTHGLEFEVSLKKLQKVITQSSKHPPAINTSDNTSNKQDSAAA